MSKLIVTFDMSNEDIPTLVVGKESYSIFGGAVVDVINVITGEKARAIRSILIGDTKKFEVTTEKEKDQKGDAT